MLRDRPLENLFPEHPALLHISEALLYRPTELLRQPSQATVSRRNQRLQTGAHQTGQHRRIATAGNRHHQWRAVDDGRKNHTAEFRCIHHIDRQITGIGIAGHPSIELLIIGSCNHQHAAVQIRLPIAAQYQLAAALLHQAAQAGLDPGRHYPKRGPRLGQQPRLAQSDLTSADHQHPAATQIVKERKKVHRKPLTVATVVCGRVTGQPSSRG
ncbi:hypothetical protein D3C81_1637720 [compost metagenome]